VATVIESSAGGHGQVGAQLDLSAGRAHGDGRELRILKKTMAADQAGKQQKARKCS
jgi:hypothetical protein